MILATLGPVTAYRLHAPKWATMPTSGAGAASSGGRANRIGLPALYLALEADTAMAEYQQLSSLMPPATLVSYTVAVNPVIDFRGGFDSGKWDPLWADFMCDWRKLWFNDHIEPPSWVLGDEVFAADAKGVLFPSTRRTAGTNLVLYTDNLAVGEVVPYDPSGALPGNQASWP
jgi:RES domain-containing protein